MVQYAARHPLRVGKLVLVTPSTRAVGLAASSEMRREIVNLHRGEPWFADAAAAFERIQAGSDADEDWTRSCRSSTGRWDATAEAHAAANEEQVNQVAAGVFGGPGAFGPEATARRSPPSSPSGARRGPGRAARPPADRRRAGSGVGELQPPGPGQLP